MENKVTKFKVLEGSFVFEKPLTEEITKEKIIKMIESIPAFYKATVSTPYAVKVNEDGNAIQFTVDVIYDERETEE